MMANASSTAGIYRIGWQSSLMLTVVVMTLVLIFGKDLKRAGSGERLNGNR